MTAGESGPTGLERRCRWLLRAYPAAYRAEHGDELLGTMLEAAPDRAWPAWREMRSVIRGGLRARSAQNQRLPARANVRLAVMLALATFLALMVATYFRQFFVLMSFGMPPGWENGLLPIWILGVVTLVVVILAWFARRAIAAPVMLVTGAAWLVLERGVILTAALTCLAVISVLGQERMPRSWLWWAAVPPAWLLAVPRLGHAHLAGISVNLLVAVAFVLCTLAWVVVDARPAFALAVLAGIIEVAVLASSYGRVGSYKASTIYLAVGITAALPLLLRTRRRTVL
jgi:hypothetical protein